MEEKLAQLKERGYDLAGDDEEDEDAEYGDEEEGEDADYGDEEGEDDYDDEEEEGLGKRAGRGAEDSDEDKGANKKRKKWNGDMNELEW